MNRTLRKAAILITASFCIAVLGAVAEGQPRRGFSHATNAHKRMTCNACHKIPAGNWANTRGFPDVADYPGHAACINCHRREMFSGNRPAFCGVCHVNPGPRGVARFPFPHQTRTQEFLSIFPHDVHQNLIAQNEKRSDVAVAHFVNASYAAATIQDDPLTFNNCALCHKTTDKIPKWIDRTITGMQPLVAAATEDFKPTAAFFKNNPDSHASCFSCHYQNVKPTRTDCAGCHSLTAPYSPTDTVARYSLKFDHQEKEHANKDCMSCHVRIAQNSDIRRMMDADVPFMTCSTTSCHGNDISKELEQRSASLAANQPAFQCIYCHAPGIGRYPVPASHQIR